MGTLLQKILLDNNFELGIFFSHFAFRKNVAKAAFVYNLKGFNYNSQTNSKELSQYNIYLETSQFQFYLRNKETDKETCTSKNFVR